MDYRILCQQNKKHNKNRPASSIRDLLIIQMEVTNISPEKVTKKNTQKGHERKNPGVMILYRGKKQ